MLRWNNPMSHKVQQETEHINEMVYSLKNKDQQLQATFDKIDQLEVKRI